MIKKFKKKNTKINVSQQTKCRELCIIHRSQNKNNIINRYKQLKQYHEKKTHNPETNNIVWYRNNRLGHQTAK